MAFDSHIRRGHPITFGLIFFFAVVEASLATWLSVRFHQHHNAFKSDVKTRAHFLCFTAWWTVLFSFLYLGLFLHSASTGSIATSVASHLGWLALTWIFWTAGAAAITQALGGGLNCSKIDFEVAYCNQLNALEGFAWATWILITFALIVVLLLGVRAVRRGEGYRGQLVGY
ncbi:hypothetical protein SISNIDRAFT_455890 [Sistotremastrum niveocremeum HHB9708]|uniref:MARVEL domain-containing protein n=2 Tax=Sistotremastraceae TaxID=3402574 RepID=A0A164T787_9AGAM|nr:hypothetical protein SISNIDRAFT_455890 [Sistotremastrum niveocremeum HHB9708]KZT35700.1 hypothetical protein SISSUDRAFT_1051063 [Sistotremastrum suecicum HHB10207 ss-3]